jgi:membrane protease YdiL (CAAX protease family)
MTELDAKQSAPMRPSRPVPLVVTAYAALTMIAICIGLVRGAPNVLLCTPSYRWSSAWLAHGTSLLLGIALASLIVGLTRVLVRTQRWFAALHEDLRPIARALGIEAVMPVALASAIGEEALFRGALVPAIGIVWSSLVFGALHQLRGRSRLTWVVFAVVVGLALGFIFRLTGSLLGPIVAHAVINYANLRFLLRHDTRRMPQLGGLLGGGRTTPDT